MIPYSTQDISEEDIQAVCQVLRSDFLTQGPTIGEFEQAFASRHQVAHAVAVSNATAGLQIACLALDVGPGSRVWTTPNTFVASANCALYCGATIDFVDIDPRTRNMSVQALAEKLLQARGTGTLPRAVIPVDFAGLPCDLREIRDLADRYGFKIIEDASHATGASYLGRPTGSDFADATVFSFHAVKIITTAEGGIVTTRDKDLAYRLRMLRSHGTTRNPLEMSGGCEGAWYYEQQSLGFNFRMTEVQSALGLSQLARLDGLHVRRELLAERYDRLIGDLPVLRPPRLADRRSSWHLYVVEVDDTRTQRGRSHVFEYMRKSGIGVNVHYIPVHTQPFYARLGFQRGDYPASERYYSRAISIPLFPALTEEQQDRIVTVLSESLA